jgi:acyl carrier protein phosphodiesterase
LPYLHHMNYLAHAYLSFHDPLLITGNLIADHVKGKQWQHYAPGIQQGIQLHRAIDEFTDTHPVTLSARECFQPTCGRYSAVFIDIVYDHFLATDSKIFPDDTLPAFSQEVYSVLQSNYQQLPATFQEVFYYMRQHDWLYNYRLLEGIGKSFNGIVRRAKFLNVPATTVLDVLEKNYDVLAESYRTFFPEISLFAQHYKA